MARVAGVEAVKRRHAQRLIAEIAVALALPAQGGEIKLAVAVLEHHLHQRFHIAPAFGVRMHRYAADHADFQRVLADRDCFGIHRHGGADAAVLAGDIMHGRAGFRMQIGLRAHLFEIVRAVRHAESQVQHVQKLGGVLGTGFFKNCHGTPPAVSFVRFIIPHLPAGHKARKAREIFSCIFQKSAGYDIVSTIEVRNLLANYHRVYLKNSLRLHHGVFSAISASGNLDLAPLNLRFPSLN